MNPIWGHIAGVATVIVMVLFIGIWVWAWLPHHKPDFDALAKLPMEDPTHGEDAR
jgi:cytochrome c oxidase cbb3-type subunit 4